MTFGDTGGWFAAYVPTDPDHWAASAWLTANQGKRLITTDYVVDELLTLLSLVPTLGVGMPSWTLRVLFRAASPDQKTTQSVEDGIPTEDRGNE